MQHPFRLVDTKACARADGAAVNKTVKHVLPASLPFGRVGTPTAPKIRWKEERLAPRLLAVAKRIGHARTYRAMLAEIA